MKRATAREIMSTPVVHIGPDLPISHAARLMREHRISGLPVVDSVGNVIGVITERDILVREAGAGGGSALEYSRSKGGPMSQRAATVRDVMSRYVVSAEPSTPAREIARLMLRHEINRVPIIEDGRLEGIVTRADVIGLFERPARAILADVRALLADEIRVDPDTVTIVVQDGVVTISGRTTVPGDASLIETYVSEIDGVASVDTSRLREPERTTA